VYCQPHADAARLRRFNRLFEVAPNRRDGNAAEAVVRAKGEDQNVRILGERRLDATHAARGGIARHAVVHDGEGQVRLAQRTLEDRRISLALPYAVT
jgi:hypothetical protein